MPNLNTNTKTRSNLLGSVVAFLFMVVFLIVLFKGKPTEANTAERKYETFDDFIRKKENGSYELRPEREAKLDRDIKRLGENAEQYVLLAKSDGPYLCLHCPRHTFYLYKGEIAKVGTTIQGEDRYTSNWLQSMNLTYFVEFRGNVHQVLEKEKIRIGHYPLTNENLLRPDYPEEGTERYKLARPPLNTKDY